MHFIAPTQSLFLEESIINRSFAPMKKTFLEKSTDQNQQLQKALVLIHPQQQHLIPTSIFMQNNQILLPNKSLIKHLKKGDCIILYGKRQKKGPQFKYCDQPGEYINFEIPVNSVYKPDDMSLQIKDAVYGNKLNLIYSHECISEGIHIREPKVYEDYPRT